MIVRIRPHPPSPRLARAAAVAATAGAAVLAAAQPAAADAPCWKKLLNDWYKPPIDNVYPLPCYRQAIKQLPTDVRVYSSARDDIERALQQAIAARRRTQTTATTTRPAPTTTADTGTTKTTSGAAPPPPPTTTGKRNKGPISRAIRDITPGGADSFPLPLLILGLLAVLLVAAGVAGLVWRRLQGRRGLP